MRCALALLVLLALPATARAHVGSPDVYFEGAAGPYRVLVTVRPPDAVPGIAEVSARVAGATHMTMVPLPAQGDGARLSPTPDVATRDKDDRDTFVGHLWLMHAGAWQVRLRVDGERGAGELAVPVPALPARPRSPRGSASAASCSTSWPSPSPRAAGRSTGTRASCGCG